MTADVLLRDGKLEKACPDCGRWEAASPRCSWCGRRFTPAEYYRNGDLEARYARFPATAPEDPPTEYLQGARRWPVGWGTYPGQKPVRQRQTPINPASDPPSRVSRPTAPRKGFLPRSPA